VIDFIPLKPTEYESWRRASIASYAEENVISGRWNREEARSRSGLEFATLLPNGLSTPGNYLYSLLDGQTSEVVGMIWFASGGQDRETKQAFVYDFEIFEAYRRRGYGTQALLRLDEQVRAMGLSSISLHVFAHNRAARDIYGKAGYRETDVIMSKEL
jgi:ribosomal protein S18 acetylase RimI-like enzyme